MAKKNQTVAEAKAEKAAKNVAVQHAEDVIGAEMVTRIPDRTRNPRDRERPRYSRGGQLDAPNRQGYKRFWAVDRNGEIEALEKRWWQKVLGEDGKPITVPAGGGQTHYLMEIEQHFADQDFADQQREIDMMTRDMTQANPGEYIPQDEHGQVSNSPLQEDRGFYREASRALSNK